MEIQRRCVCGENEQLGDYLLKKRQEIVDSPKGISDNLDMTLQKAYSSICNSKTHITNLKDLSKIKGVGKWILRLVQGFFDTASENEDLTRKGKENKGTRRYMPQKNSVAYALLVTLYRGIATGVDYMRKSELIDAAEASGLSRAPIMPEKGKGKPRQFGSSPREWYSGWSCMKTLVTKGLVIKSSCPAKYMLTEEGKKAARECLSRSGLATSSDTVERSLDFDESNLTDKEFPHTDSVKESRLNHVSIEHKKSAEVPPESLNRFLSMGYSKEQILLAFSNVQKSSPNKNMSSLWPAVLCHLREAEVYGSSSDFQNNPRCDPRPRPLPTNSYTRDGSGSEGEICISKSEFQPKPKFHTVSSQIDLSMKACSTTDNQVLKQHRDGRQFESNVLTVPPLSFGETFKDAYDVILILDDREKFTTQGSKTRKIVENISKEFNIEIEIRRLPVGDAIWVARHKQFRSEYVLDLIVERKRVDDLRSSIRDNRYRDQKVRLLRCGLKKLIYVVEGDVNFSEAAESLKTACFTTEILEGFDVQRTTGLGDTLRKYGFLTQAIIQYYSLLNGKDKHDSPDVCPPYSEFVKKCEDLDKITVSDVFAIQLMQVPQVTEEVAMAVLELYPTVLSLVRAYSAIDGNIYAQEEMLKKQSNGKVNGSASKNIFQLIWGN
ncbi:crossover junction endonuclease MUS81 isoform X2 [Apium graveolens]|uniref:crossover junction endonuclease MUS81 isoform X2 n=1 Tax=Apium graveolens TaxID=4045 RepID=UPI003D7BA00B